MFFIPAGSEATLCKEWYFKYIMDSWNEKKVIPNGGEQLVKLGIRKGFVMEEALTLSNISPANRGDLKQTCPPQKKRKNGRFLPELSVEVVESTC